MTNQDENIEGRLRPRTTPKPNHDSSILAKVKCDICSKFYRFDYLKVRTKIVFNDIKSSFFFSSRNINNVLILIKKFYLIQVKQIIQSIQFRINQMIKRIY